MRYKEFKIEEAENDTTEPDDQTQADAETPNTTATTAAPSEQELTTPEPPKPGNPVATNNSLGNSLQSLFMGLFGTVLSSIAGQNPAFAGILRTILSGNSGGFNFQQMLSAAPAPLRSQVEQVLQHVDPETGQLNNDGTRIQPANNASGWTRIRVGNEEYEVGNDLVRQGGYYAIFSGSTAKQYADSRGWIVPPIEVITAVYQRGRKLKMPGRNNNPTDKNAQAHTRQIFEANGLSSFPSGLVCGHKKEVVASNTNRTRIYGGWNGRSVIQSDSSAHGPTYVDYSQGLRPCKKISGQQTNT